MKNFLKQHQGQHGCLFKTGRARLQSVLLLMLLTWMLLPARMAAQTNYDASVTFTAITGSNTYFGSEGYENLFDGKKTESNFSKWCCNFSSPTYVIFEASLPGTPVGYTITTGNDNNRENGRNPKSWNLYGNNEGENGRWTLIQTVTDDETLKDENYTSYNFTCDGIGSYKYFKWEITATQGASVMQVAEFELKLITCTHKNEDGSSALGEPRYTEPATCTKRGYSRYWCSICQNMIDIENDGDLAPHTLIHHEANAPKCTETGNKEYWQCDVCSKLFGDEAATNELADLSATVIPAAGHKNNTQGKCSVCGAIDPHYAQYDTSVTFTAIAGRNGKEAIDGQGYENLFDGKKTKDSFSKWSCTFDSFYGKTYVIFEASKPGTPIGYTITAGDHIPTSSTDNRYPNKWYLYANNEGVDGEWTLIGTDGAEIYNDALEGENYKSCDFECDVEKPYKSYKYFKWEIEHIGMNWDDIMDVGEFELKLVTCWHKKADGSSALGEAISTKPATCISHSFTTHLCSICNKEVEIEEDGEFGPHALTYHEAKAPTCTETGLKEYWHCSVCDKNFGDEKATNELADLSTIVVPATGHDFNPEGTCSVCSYTDLRFAQIVMNGITIKNITDNKHPWEVLDPTADDLKKLGIEEGSKGLMSSNDNGTSSSEISLKSDKPFVMSFNYGTSDFMTTLQFFVDDEEYIAIYGPEVYETKIMLSAGEHKVKLVCEKEKKLSHAFIYNINAEYSYTGAVAEYNQETKTLTLKYQENGEARDNMFTIQNGHQLYKSVIGKQKETEHIVIDESFKTYKPIESGLIDFFSYFEALTKIEGLGNINISQVKYMDCMFMNCINLKEFDIDKLNTENIESMANMFSGCESLETIDLSGFNTASVRDMSYMFSSCKSLNSLIAPDVDKDNLYNYSRILSGCPATVYCSIKEATKGSNSVFASNTMSPYVSINPKAKYGTLCVPFGSSTLEEGSFSGFDKIYTIKECNTIENKIMLEEAKSIEPGVAYIYRRNLTDTDPVANAITFIADLSDESIVTAPVNDGMLKGTFEATMAPLGTYVLQSDGMFHPVRSKTIKVGAYRAYLELPGFDNTGGVEEAKNFLMIFEDDETTDVKGVYEYIGSMAPTVYYDLMGRRVSSPAKGQVYIVNGKKVRY